MQLARAIKPLSGGLRKKFGGAKRPARTAREDGCDGKKRFSIFAPRFGPYLRHTFGFFQKKWKQTILFRDFLREKCVDRKKKVHHDDLRGKCKTIAVSDFSFSKLCHRDFCETCGTLLAFLKKSQNRPFCFAIFSVKNASTEKIKYTTTICAEKRRT